MEFYTQIGKLALGSRLRRLSERVTEDAAQVYELYDIDLKPKWFPVFYALSQEQEKTITAIAEEIGHSHPSVSKIVCEMVKKAWVVEKKDKNDGRRNVVKLSKKGIEAVYKINPQYIDVNAAVEEVLQKTQHDLWKAMSEWEYHLNQKSLFKRVLEQKKLRESKEVTIVAYQSKYQQAFKALNEEWISTYFKMEEADYNALENPKSYILNKGGHILVALYKKEPVGVCALIKMNDPDYDYELAKMAVSPKAQGKSIGWLLGKAIIEKARAIGARSIYLESNTILKPAIQLYQKLGFQKVGGRPSPYERCNIQMDLQLKTETDDI